MSELQVDQAAPEKSAANSDSVQSVFEFWRVRMGHPRARLDQKRRQKIRQRLLDGYSAQDLIDAIEGCALSPFHMGTNDRHTVFNDIELICRDAKHVDQFLRINDEQKARRAQAAHRERLQREYEERKRAELQQAGRYHLKVAK